MLVLALLACGQPDVNLGSNTDDNTGLTGSAVAEITPAELVWTDADVGFSSVLDLTITSVGDGDLEVYEIALMNDTTGTYVFDRVRDETIAPGEAKTWPVTCDLEEAITAEANLRVRTNDPDATEVSVPLSCSPG